MCPILIGLFSDYISLIVNMRTVMNTAKPFLIICFIKYIPFLFLFLVFMKIKKDTLVSVKLI